MLNIVSPDNGWRVRTAPGDHIVSQISFDVIIDASGKKGVLPGRFN